MTEDRTWKIWVCPACWAHIGCGDDEHRITQEGEWLCEEQSVEFQPVQIEVGRRLVTAL